MAQWAGNSRGCGLPWDLGHLRKTGVLMGSPPPGRAEQMAQRIMKIQLCSLLGRLSLEVGEAAPPNCAQKSQPPKTAYAKRLPVWRLWSP